jgi:hypothetical protein
MSETITREAWLLKLADLMRDTLFKQAGASFENGEYRVSVGWSARRKAIGECWPSIASSKQYREIFIGPKLDDALTVAATLAHELCHAALPDKSGHKRAFQKLADAIGLVKPWTATTPGGTFMKWWRDEAEEIMGAYPHAAMMRDTLKKQTTRLIKVHCPACQDAGEPYLARMSAQAIQRGLPICPVHNVDMAV